jgi:superfamily II DNA/RNA helicase
VANTIDLDGEEEIKSEDEIDVLVATGAMSEGFNFQDAPVLINFDLPWTVLVLAQRMGRILRPWHEPREIVVYNLFHQP